MIEYTIIAKRWFDKINGNTYHSVVIFDNKTSNLIYSSGMVYGYDEAYKQTAKHWLISQNRLNKKDEYNHELIRATILFSVTDVCRKKDLDLNRVG